MRFKIWTIVRMMISIVTDPLHYYAISSLEHELITMKTVLVTLIFT